MAESLEDFLGVSKDKKFINAEGCSLSCPECDEVVNSGKLDEDELILYYSCSNGHNSRVKL